MIGHKALGAAVLMSAIAATSASAQAAFGEPAAFQAQHPDRDVLNGGAVTPAGRLGLERRYGGGGGTYVEVPSPYPAPVRRRYPRR